VTRRGKATFGRFHDASFSLLAHTRGNVCFLSDMKASSRLSPPSASSPRKNVRDAPGICVPGGHNARAPHAGLVARDPVAYLDAKPRVTRPPPPRLERCRDARPTKPSEREEGAPPRADPPTRARWRTEGIPRCPRISASTSCGTSRT